MKEVERAVEYLQFSIDRKRDRLPNRIQIYVEKNGSERPPYRYYMVADVDNQGRPFESFSPRVFWLTHVHMRHLVSHEILSAEHGGKCIKRYSTTSSVNQFISPELWMTFEYWTHYEQFSKLAGYWVVDQVPRLKKTIMQLVVGQHMLSVSRRSDCV